MLRKISIPSIALLVIVSNQSCKTFAGANPLSSVWSGVANDRQFSILADLLKTTGWADKLNDKNAQYTLFAPTNEAFQKLGNEKLQELKKPENSATLLSIIESHIYAGKLDKELLATAGVLPPSVNGKTYPVQRKNNRWFIGNARPAKNPEYARNGLFYVLEDVLQ
jgi:transforming growth factor-beta-induced protein